MNENPERYALEEDFPVVNAAWIIDLFQPEPDKNALN
jgi:hypothetical protein